MPSGRSFSLAVESGEEGRLDRFLAARLQDEAVSREKIKTLVRDGACTHNGELCREVSRRVRRGDTLCLRLPEALCALVPEEGELDILYEDEALLVLNKPAGVTVHPAPGLYSGTLVQRLVARFPELREQEGLRPGIVHRLDKDTSGLLCVARTEAARLRLAAAFAAREVRKEYLALVEGIPPSGEIRDLRDLARPPARPFSGGHPQGRIRLPVGRHPVQKHKMSVLDVSRGGREADTEWRLLRAGRKASLLAVRIHTGRTHQIRVHMAALGHPLLGDRVYGSGDGAPRQMLHASNLSLRHPSTNEVLSFFCAPPEDFVRVAQRAEALMQRVVVTSVAGCGKSAFMQVLVDQGVPVWSADAAVIRLYEAGQPGWLALREAFGDRFIPSPTSPVDRRAVAQALLPESADRLSADRLNALIHPLVLADLDRFWQETEASGAALAVAEVPLWFESGWASSPQAEGLLIVGLACEEGERRRRLLEVRGWTEEMMVRMDALQWGQERKMAACDLVIRNDGSLEDLAKACSDFLSLMRSKREDQARSFREDWEKLMQDQKKD